jgi:hypothetical protein
MSFLKNLFPKPSLKIKILDIEDSLKRTVARLVQEKVFIYWYGAYDISPKHLVFWICVETNKSRDSLQGNKELYKKLRDLLVKHDYPAEFRDSVYIGFESQQNVDESTGGNWYHHFK